MHEEEGWRAFVGRLADFLTKTVPTKIADKPDLTQQASEVLRGRVLKNISLRNAALVVFNVLLSISDLPDSAEEALEEWKTKKAANKSSDTFHENAFELLGLHPNIKDANFDI